MTLSRVEYDSILLLTYFTFVISLYAVLTGLHFLLTYTCLYECDHCFLYCGPSAGGTFTIDQIEEALSQAVRAGINSVYLEGGEPFLYYPLMVEALRMAKKHKLWTGIVTDCYFALSERDAEIWLKPIMEIGLDSLSVSDDIFHSEDLKNSPAKIAVRAALKLGMDVSTICIEKPVSIPKINGEPGQPVVGGDVRFIGRAVEKLIQGLPRRHFESFDECPHEKLDDPERVHLDPFGNIFVCQGLSIGNIWKRPLKKIMDNYQPDKHPIIGPLLKGGPAELAKQFGLPEGNNYVDHCHLCYLIRKKLIDRFPEYLCPGQVYGIKEE